MVGHASWEIIEKRILQQMPELKQRRERCGKIFNAPKILHLNFVIANPELLLTAFSSDFTTKWGQAFIDGAEKKMQKSLADMKDAVTRSASIRNKIQYL